MQTNDTALQAAFMAALDPRFESAFMQNAAVEPSSLPVLGAANLWTMNTWMRSVAARCQRIQPIVIDFVRVNFVMRRSKSKACWIRGEPRRMETRRGRKRG